jgi:hypothetical protein
MKKLLLFLFIILVACNSHTRLQKIFTDADLLKVYIYSAGTVPVVHYETNNIDKIKEWSNYISEKDATPGNCNFEGKLIFKFAFDSTVMKFSLKPGCTYVNYTVKDSTFNKQLTDEGVSYLKGLMKIQ